MKGKRTFEKSLYRTSYRCCGRGIRVLQSVFLILLQQN